MITNWHLQQIEQVLKDVQSTLEGITRQEAEHRLRQYGPNELKSKNKKPVWRIFLNQFMDFMVLVLIAAAIISGLIGDVTDTVIILIIVLLNAILGFVQEYRAEKALEALKKMAALNANVIRQGKIQTVPAEELVPGDVVVMEAGNVVPADIRLLEAHSVKADESSLTGESISVDKVSETLKEKDLPLGDRFNLLYKTTLLTAGRATGVVVATGMNTEIGQIAHMLEGKEAATPLQRRMADFGRKLSYLILFLCALLFGIGILRGEEMVRMLLLSISLAVAAIPEALPALITIALALGAKRMVKVNALIRKLHAVETLGSVTFICSDKTGTLTLNKMKVVETTANKNVIEKISELTVLELSMAISHDVKLNQQQQWTGDSTEIALVEYIAGKQTVQHIEDLQNKYKRVAELPFDSYRKCMTTVHQFENRFLVISKGAVETIAALLNSAVEREEVLQKANELAQKGIRVIAFGHRFLSALPEPFNHESVEKDFTYGGLAGMIDPPRPEVKIAIGECNTAGIHTVMITGDHPATAAAIAKEIGILSENQLVVTGAELQKMSSETLNEKVELIRVYARVSPEQKLSIVKALQNKNHFVAMTGDGVNDAPSLKSANIGIAMGINGSDVSKEAAHMILLDDNFATIVKAVKEGRRIYDNIRKFVKYIMTCNGAEIWTIFLAPLFMLPMPLLPIHILWINLVTDGLPGLALANEKAEPHIMNRPPRKSDDSLFSDGIGFHIIWVGLLMAGVTLAAQAWSYHAGSPNWQTIVFTVLSLSQMGHVLAIRSEYEFLYKRGIFSNLPLIAAVLLTFIIQLIIIYLPAANSIFKTHPLKLNELAICIVLSAVVFHAVEFEKWIKTRLQNRKAE